MLQLLICSISECMLKNGALNYQFLIFLAVSSLLPFGRLNVALSQEVFVNYRDPTLRILFVPEKTACKPKGYIENGFSRGRRCMPYGNRGTTLIDRQINKLEAQAAYITEAYPPGKICLGEDFKEALRNYQPSFIRNKDYSNVFIFSWKEQQGLEDPVPIKFSRAAKDKPEGYPNIDSYVRRSTSLSYSLNNQRTWLYHERAEYLKPSVFNAWTLEINHPQQPWSWTFFPDDSECNDDSE